MGVATGTASATLVTARRALAAALKDHDSWRSTEWTFRTFIDPWWTARRRLPVSRNLRDASVDSAGHALSLARRSPC